MFVYTWSYRNRWHGCHGLWSSHSINCPCFVEATCDIHDKKSPPLSPLPQLQITGVVLELRHAICRSHTQVACLCKRNWSPEIHSCGYCGCYFKRQWRTTCVNTLCHQKPVSCWCWSISWLNCRENRVRDRFFISSKLFWKLMFLPNTIPWSAIREQQCGCQMWLSSPQWIIRLSMDMTIFGVEDKSPKHDFQKNAQTWAKHCTLFLQNVRTLCIWSKTRQINSKRPTFSSFLGLVSKDVWRL